MNLDIRPVGQEHLDAVQDRLQPHQKEMLDYLKRENYLTNLLANGEGYAVVDTDSGKVFACLGVEGVWNGRGVAWALLTEDCRPVMLSLTRVVKYFLRSHFNSWRRLEAYVDPDFPSGMRWVEMFGFKREGYLRRFTPDDKDQHLYALVKEA